MSSSPAISAAGISKAYRIYRRPQDRLLQIAFRGRRRYHTDFWALRDVSFDVAPGTTLGVIGRNGCGKSTLLQIVAGTLRPTRGQVVTRGRVSALLELGTGFNPEFSGRENVFLNAVILGLSPREAEGRYEDIVAFADIGDFLDQPIKTYSSGMVVRLAFAIAISVDPGILIVDEALSVGDIGFQRKCYRRINELRERGTTCLFVTHDTGIIRTLCDEALLLERGAILERGDTKSVADRYVRLMLGEPQMSDTPAPEDEPADTWSGAPEGEAEPLFAEPQFSAIPRDLRFDIGEPRGATVQGDRRVYVSKSLLLDELGGTPRTMYVGGVYRIRSLIEFSEPVDGFYYGVLLRDRFGQDIFGDSVASTELGIGESFRPGDAVVIDTVVRADLRQDTYFVTLGIEDLAHASRLFYAMDVMQMRLEPLGSRVFGVTRLPRRFEGRRLAGSSGGALQGG